MNSVARTPARQCNDKTALARRPAHPLNDKPVRLAPGAKQTPRFKDGATLGAGSDESGIVWAVAAGSAIVDFGSFSGHSVLVIVAESDLIAQ